MKSFVSVDNTMEVLLGVPEHREPQEVRQREIEGFKLAYREEHSDGPHGLVSTTITLVFKK